MRSEEHSSASTLAALQAAEDEALQAALKAVRRKGRGARYVPPTAAAAAAAAPGGRAPGGAKGAV